MIFIWLCEFVFTNSIYIVFILISLKYLAYFSGGDFVRKHLINSFFSSFFPACLISLLSSRFQSSSNAETFPHFFKRFFFSCGQIEGARCLSERLIQLITLIFRGATYFAYHIARIHARRLSCAFYLLDIFHAFLQFDK